MLSLTIPDAHSTPSVSGTVPAPSKLLIPGAVAVTAQRRGLAESARQEENPAEHVHNVARPAFPSALNATVASPVQPLLVTTTYSRTDGKSGRQDKRASLGY